MGKCLESKVRILTFSKGPLKELKCIIVLLSDQNFTYLGLDVHPETQILN